MRVLRSAIAAFLLAWVPACYSYRTTQLAPEQAVVGQKPIVVRVPDGAGTREVKLHSPWVRNDSIGGRQCTMGRTPTGHTSETCATDWSVPLTEVRAIETRHFDAGTTAKVTTGVVAVAAILALAIVHTVGCETHPDDLFC